MESNNNKQLPKHADLRVSQPINQSRVGDGNSNENIALGNASGTPSLPDANQSLNLPSSSTRGFYNSGNLGEDRRPLNNNSDQISSFSFGESLRGSGSVSAPPPGFSQNFDMNRQKQEYANEPNSLLSNLNSFTIGTGAAPSRDESLLNQRETAVRSTSFANLAAALGEGLAESMDDSCQDGNKDASHFLNRYQNQIQNHSLSSFPAYEIPRNGSIDNKYNLQDRSGSRSVPATYASPLMFAGNTENDGKKIENSNTNTMIGNPNSSERIFQSTTTPASTFTALPKGASMNLTEESDNYNDPSAIRINERQYHNVIGNRSNTTTPSSLAQAVSQIKRSATNSSVYSTESQNLPGFNSRGSSLLRNQSSLLAHRDLKLKKGSNGRSSAPPNLFISSIPQKQHTLLNHNQLNIHRVQSPAISYTAQTSSLDPRRTTPSPSLPTNPEPSNSITPGMLSSDQEVLAEFELEPFVYDAMAGTKQAKPSRGLIILGLSSILKTFKIGIAEIQTTCEAFGALETFRTDFATTKGVIFFSYFNLLHAQHAAMELGGYLARFAGVDNANSLHGPRQSDFSIKVKYCIPLHSSAHKDDSLILLSNLHSSTDEDSLTSMMESYGAVKAIHYQMVSNDQSQQNHSQENGYNFEEEDEWKETQSYTVEFFDIQDAKHALLELVNCQPLGKNVKVERGMTNPSTRRKGIKLVTLLGKWRQGQGPQDRPVSFTPPVTTTPPPLSHVSERSSTHSIPKSNSPVPVIHPHNGHRTVVSPAPQFNTQHVSGPQAQLLISPDGQYQYVMLNPQSSQGGQVQHVMHSNHPHYVPAGTQIHNHPGVPHNPNSSQYWTVAHPAHQSSPYPTTHVILQQPGVPTSSPYLVQNAGIPAYANMTSNMHSDNPNISNGNHRNSSNKKGSSNSNKHRQSGDATEENLRLALDINFVANGTDTRSSLMVRNIPNKYTQQMLLAEFTEFGHGSDKIDFFYLPIDFKNRCNRGYAFINFVDYKDIIPFHEQYNNKQWRVFNSDKVCAITYARIQGKAAMLKRFEHSALLDKNDEYRPLVFTSHGVNKGKRENFPSNPSSDTKGNEK